MREYAAGTRQYAIDALSTMKGSGSRVETGGNEKTPLLAERVDALDLDGLL